MLGKPCKRGLVLVVMFLVDIAAASAQAPDPQSVTGKIDNESESGQIRFETIMQYKDVPSETMRKSMLGVFSIVTHAPAVNPPRGFDVDPSLSVYCDLNPIFSPFEGSVDFDKVPVQATLRMMSFNYYLDQYSHKIKKTGESHGGLELFVNDLSYALPDQFKNQCEDAGVRLFFFLPNITSKNAGRVVIDNHVIILKKRGRSIFTPMRRQEYTRFLINKYKLDLSKANDEAAQNREDLSEEQHNLETTNDPKVKDYIRRFIRDAKQSVSQSVKKITELKNRIVDERDSLKEMSDSELRAPVYVVRNYKDPDGDFYYKLSSPSVSGARELYTVNPRYYNPALPRSTIQLIGINYHTSNFCPLFLKQRLEDWFHQIDYNKLSTLLAGL